MVDPLSSEGHVKACSRCGVWLPLERFVVARRNRSGRGGHCKACDAKLTKARQVSKAETEGRQRRTSTRKAPADRNGERLCLECESWLPLDQFHRAKTGRAGYASYCKPCASKMDAARRSRKYSDEGRVPRSLRPAGPADSNGQRQCRDCDEWMPLDQFAASPTRKDGRGSYCQPCMNKRSVASYAKRVRQKHGREVQQREELPEGMRRCADCKEVWDLQVFPKGSNYPGGRGYYCRPCHTERGRQSKERNFGGTREYHLQRRYGIGHADFEDMLAEQGGVCAVCRRPDPQHVDHNHRTGVIRGILCFNCNAALGHVKDDPDRITAMLEYLYECNNPWEPVSSDTYVQMRRVIPQTGRNGRGELLRDPLPPHLPDLAGDKPWTIRRV